MPQLSPAKAAVATLKPDRKSTRLNSSHITNAYAVFCLKKKKTEHKRHAVDIIHRRNARARCHRRQCALSEAGLYPAVIPRHRHRIVFFFNDTATTEIYTLSLHDALPI